MSYDIIMYEKSLILSLFFWFIDLSNCKMLVKLLFRYSSNIKKKNFHYGQVNRCFYFKSVELVLISYMFCVVPLKFYFFALSFVEVAT